MSDEMEVVEYRHHQIKVYQDEDPEDPRKAFDNFGHMLCHHPRYELGDEKMEPEDIIGRIFDKWQGSRGESKLKPEIAIALPLVILDHSGIWMRVGSSFTEDPGGWDTSMVGYIYVTKEEVIKEYGLQRIGRATRYRGMSKALAKAKKVLLSEVEEYSDYLSGSVYGYVVEGPGCDDSCWGFYGDSGYQYMIQEAKAAIDYYYSKAGEQLEMFPERVVG